MATVCDKEIKNKDIGKYLGIKSLRNYKVTNFVGKGAVGSVYKIEMSDDSNNKSYALKVISLSTKSNKVKFEKEKKIFKEFTKRHKNIIKVRCRNDNINCYLEVKSNPECGYIVMEYYDTDLGQYLDKIGNFNKLIVTNPQDIYNKYVKWIKDLYSAISFIHSRNIAHSDIKPENILVNLSNDSLVVTDFDTVCLPKERLECPTKEEPCRPLETSILYTSPNLEKYIKKCVPIDILKESDIWALAIIILELWFGRDKIQKLFKLDNFSFRTDFYENLEKDDNIYKAIGKEIDKSINSLSSMDNKYKLKLQALLYVSLDTLNTIRQGKKNTGRFTQYINRIQAI